MRVWERWTFNILTALVTASGVAYLWMKYFMAPVDPLAVINHPLQPLMLQVHLLASPLLILTFGIIFQSHIARKITSGYKPNRRSGLLALITFGIMASSGYMLQVVSDPGWSRAVLFVHLGSAGVFAVAYLLHLLASVHLMRAYAKNGKTRTLAA